MIQKKQDEYLKSLSNDSPPEHKEAKPEPTPLSIELRVEECDFDAQTV